MIDYMKNERSVSVICVSNNIEQLENELLPSLNKQNYEYELVILDNTSHRFDSAAQALNYGASHSKGDLLVFSHQDIILKTDDELRKFVEIIANTEVGDIVGTQGVREGDKKLWSNLTGGRPIVNDLVFDFTENSYEVSCVDEGFFGMKRATWLKHNFDEIVCDNWHLYCVEACLYARKNGHRVLVSPIQIHHSSMGHISIGYMENMKKLCKVYRSSHRYIWTTCYKVRTNIIYINLLVFIWKLNRLIRGRSLD